jgi:hypothetical protein
MTDLLSKEHSILERPFMEFRPFGVNERGGKIRDISGAIVKANMEHLVECVRRVSGPEAAAWATQELCRLLNERIRDPAYHVTPKFLNNIWNSYSYEFVCYVREFCQQLSGEPKFHFNTGRYQHITAVTRILGQHLSIAQILSMYAVFVQKYASRDVVEIRSRHATEGSIVIQLKLTEQAFRQFGPYRKRCAAMVCEAARGALIGLPERIHNLPPANVVDRTCMVNGDQQCEWEVTWTPTEGTWLSRIIKRLFASLQREKIGG